MASVTSKSPSKPVQALNGTTGFACLHALNAFLNGYFRNWIITHAISDVNHGFIRKDCVF